VKDPVRQLEHAHGHLNKLLLEASGLIRAAELAGTVTTWDQLAAPLASLRDELLKHFADEEEALFPFIRASVPAKVAAVDGLEAAHDTICNCIARLAHLAAGKERLTLLLTVRDRFEAAYVRHSSDEATLFEELAVILDDGQRDELARRLHGL